MRATALLACLLIAACNGAPDEGGSATRVLLITLDTVRADRIGVYGRREAHTPHIDRLAREGVLFENAIAPTPITLPSHASILTGVNPPAHGVRDNGIFELGQDAKLLSEAFRERGWRTAAFVGSRMLDARFGLDQGFDVYGEAGVDESPSAVAISERPANEVVAAALDWLATVGEDESFFLWIHLIDPHLPYDPPEPWRSRLEDPYDAEIAFADAELGKLLEFLERRGLDEGLLVALTADHGESLGEHGEETHGILLYQATLRVPLILSGRPLAARRGERVKAPAPLTAVPATLLALAGAPADSLPRADAALLSTDGAPAPGERSIYVETLLPYHSWNLRALRGLVWKGHKLIEGERDELYDLDADPEESGNLAEREPGELAEMRDRLDAQLEESAPLGWGSPRAVRGNEAALLQALGYAAGLDTADGDPFADSLEDPGGALDQVALLHEAQGLLEGARLADLEQMRGAQLDPARRAELARIQRENTEAARVRLRELYQRNPGNPQVPRLLGVTEVALGNAPAAIPLLERAVREQPKSSMDRYALATGYHAVGRDEDARREIYEALRLEPRQPQYYRWLAQLRYDAGEYGQASWLLSEALQVVGPDSPHRDEMLRLIVVVDKRVQRAGQAVERPPDFPLEELRAAREAAR